MTVLASHRLFSASALLLVAIAALAPVGAVAQVAFDRRDRLHPVVAEHGMVPDRFDAVRNTRTTLVGPLQRLFLAPNRVNYHLEHHLLMRVPHYRLRDLGSSHGATLPRFDPNAPDSYDLSPYAPATVAVTVRSYSRTTGHTSLESVTSRSGAMVRMSSASRRSCAALRSRVWGSGRRRAQSCR